MASSTVDSSRSAMDSAENWILDTGDWLLNTGCSPTSGERLLIPASCLLSHASCLLSPNLHLENMGAVATTVTVGTTNEDVAQKLHFNFLKAGAAATLALPLAGVETEGAGVQAALPGQVGLSEKLPDIVKGADINRGIGPGSFAKDGLVDQDDALEALAAFNPRRNRSC